MTLSGEAVVWFALTFLFIGLSGGIVIGVKIDRNTVVNQIFKKIRHKKGTGDLVIEGNQDIPEKKTWKERREEKKRPKATK